MSLSQKNIDKLCMTGIYHCDPVLSWIEPSQRDYPYCGINWNFKVRKHAELNKYYMYDTHWPDDCCLKIELTDENFDKFELLFDINDVHRVCPFDFWNYDEEDRWHLALDSNGFHYEAYYFVRNDAKKNNKYLLEILNKELDILKRQVKDKEEEIKKALEEIE